MTIRICRLKTPPVLVLLSLAAAPPCVTAEDKIVLNDDGGWCWFQDERAIVDSHRVIVGSVASGVTDATRRGSVEVTTWDTVTGGRVTVPLHPGLALDDHNAPALLVRSGGRSLAGVSEPARASSPARVACIGDSITYGAKVVDRGHNAYPAQLQPRLGAGYEVRNFGVGGRTLLQAADTPYVATDAWRNVVAWAPDVAVVMLGTNDTCQSDRRRNWEHADELAASTRSLIDGLRAANPRVRVLLVRPPPMFPGQPGLAEPRRLDLAERDPRLAVIGHTLAAVAATIDGVEYHDLDRVLEVRHVVDGVHPNAFGAEAIADRFAEVILPAGVFPANPAVRSVPSAEYRGHPAGWGGGTWWDQLHAMRRLASADEEAAVVFLGDSITQSLSGAHDRRSRPGGTRPFDRFHDAGSALALGLSGDRTEHLLFRIDHGALTTIDPQVIVLQIGVNNINSAGHTAIETAAGIEAVVDHLRVREPQATVVLCGPFPLGAPGEPRRVAIDRVHTIIAPLGDRPDVIYLDLRGLFLDSAGRANERMARDLVHLTAAGYEAWMAAIEPSVTRCLAE